MVVKCSCSGKTAHPANQSSCVHTFFSHLYWTAGESMPTKYLTLISKKCILNWLTVMSHPMLLNWGLSLQKLMAEAKRIWLYVRSSWSSYSIGNCLVLHIKSLIWIHRSYRYVNCPRGMFQDYTSCFWPTYALLERPPRANQRSTAFGKSGGFAWDSGTPLSIPCVFNVKHWKQQYEHLQFPVCNIAWFLILGLPICVYC